MMMTKIRRRLVSSVVLLSGLLCAVVIAAGVWSHWWPGAIVSVRVGEDSTRQEWIIWADGRVVWHGTWYGVAMNMPEQVSRARRWPMPAGYGIAHRTEGWHAFGFVYSGGQQRIATPNRWWWYQISLWVIAAALAAPPLLRISPWARRRRRRERGQCVACGYDLRGLTSDRCPECGTAITTPRVASSTPPPQ